MMDKFTRIYSLVLLVVGLGVLIGVFFERPIVSDLNARLKDDKTLAAYPYQFRVTKVSEGTATMTTPRSAEVPTSLALPLLYPELRNEETNSAAFLDAQEEMARFQSRAAKLVMMHEDVTSIAWTLDTKWLRNNGIKPDLLRAGGTDVLAVGFPNGARWTDGSPARIHSRMPRHRRRQLVKIRM